MVEAALVARSSDEAGLMARSFVGKRRGYANTHDEPSAETMVEKGLVHENALDDGELFKEYISKGFIKLTMHLFGIIISISLNMPPTFLALH